MVFGSRIGEWRGPEDALCGRECVKVVWCKEGGKAERYFGWGMSLGYQGSRWPSTKIVELAAKPSQETALSLLFVPAKGTKIMFQKSRRTNPTEP